MSEALNFTGLPAESHEHFIVDFHLIYESLRDVMKSVATAHTSTAVVTKEQT